MDINLKSATLTKNENLKPGPRPWFFIGEAQLKPSGKEDLINYYFMKSIAFLVVILLFSLVFFLIKASNEAITEFGVIDFFLSKKWNPVEDEFGALPFIFGTVFTSILALLFAAPLSVMVAVFINEICPKWLGNIIGLFVEMIAAIPSIVFGLWGLFYLVPWVSDSLSPWIKENISSVGVFGGPSFGIGILSASMILSVMIIPTITSICREVFKTIPPHQKEAALALGATRLEMIELTVLRPSFAGIMGGIVLGLGRALGETMAVAMVIGNAPKISMSIFSTGATMASVIANEYAEASSDLHVASLCLIAVLLFMVTLVINALARFIVWKFSVKKGFK